MELPQKRLSIDTEEANKKPKNDETVGRHPNKTLLSKLGKNLWGLIFGFLSQKDYFTSIIVLNKRLNSLFNSYQLYSSSFQMRWNFDKFNKYKYDKIAMKNVYKSLILKKLTIKNRPITYKNNVTTINCSTMMLNFRECQWTKTIVNLEIDINKIILNMSYFFDSLISLKSLKIHLISAKPEDIFYLVKKFIDSENLFDARRELKKFGNIVYYPLEKCYCRAIVCCYGINLFNIIHQNQNLVVFEFVGIRFQDTSENFSVSRQRSLKKLSIKNIGHSKIDSMKDFISLCFLEHLHLDLFRVSDSIAYLIKNQDTIKCLKLLYGIEYVDDLNFSRFLRIISGSALKKVQIEYIKLIHEKCFIEFLNSLEFLEKLTLKFKQNLLFYEDFLMDCLGVTKVRYLNKKEKVNFYPNQFGVLKISPIDLSIKNDAIHSIAISKSILEAQNLTKIEYPDHFVIIDHLVNTDDLSGYFSTVHKFYSDNLEDLYIFSKVKYTNNLQEVHLIGKKNLLFNNCIFFQMMSNFSEYFGSVRILHILIEPDAEGFIFDDSFAEKLLSLPNLEEFYLNSNNVFGNILKVHSTLKCPSLQKFSVKNYNGEFTLFRLPIENVSYLELPGEMVHYISNSTDILSVNKRISTLIIHHIKTLGSNNYYKKSLKNIMKSMKQKSNIQKMEITFHHNFVFGMWERSDFSQDYMEFLKIFFENNPLLTDFNFYYKLFSNLYQEFNEIILKFCRKNQAIVSLFGMPINKINCLKLFSDNKTKIIDCILFFDLGIFPTGYKPSKKIEKIETVTFLNFLNEYHCSESIYNFISFDEFSKFYCNKIIIEDFEYDHSQMKQILTKIKSNILSTKQCHFDKFHNHFKLPKKTQIEIVPIKNN